MIIYCAGPIKGDPTYKKEYAHMIDFVDELGHTALAESNEKFNASIPLTDKQIYKRDIKWIDSCQLMIAEVSGPSLGVGFEIAYGLFQKQIPVLALVYAEVRNLSAMLSGCASPLLTIERYAHVDEIKNIIREYLKQFNN